MPTTADTRIRTAALTGIDGVEVQVEVDLSRGMPGFHLVGLPGTEVRESRDRVLSALRNCGCRVPADRITINLAPAGLRKEGASFDLAIAMAIISAGSRVRDEEALARLARTCFLGELSLFGELRPVRGALAMVMAAGAAGCDTALVPAEQTAEAGLVPGVRVLGFADLRQVVRWWVHGAEPGGGGPAPTADGTEEGALRREQESRLKELMHSLRGMPLLRKAALVALAGRHNILLCGPPGTGKTRLARGLGALLPPLGGEQALAVTRIHSARGTLPGAGLVRRRPFRAPHHTVTRAGLVGGGADLAPGEVTLAHHGVLFLDELPEFGRGVLDALREPLEEGWVHLVRGRGQRSYPADFQLVGAMNPCRCGRLGAGVGACRCSAPELARYRARLSGPLLDRFDLMVEVAAWEGAFLETGGGGSPEVAGPDWREAPSLDLLHRVAGQPRCRTEAGRAAVAEPARRHLEWARRSLGLSLRGVHRCLQVAGTLARLDQAAESPGAAPAPDGQVERRHVVEALELRRGLPEG